MNVLDSPLEALAFNYVSFGLFTVVNNLWTWVAVLTAAVSFWRFRPRAPAVAGSGSVSSCCVKSRSPPSNYDQSSSGSSSPVSEIVPPKAAVEPPRSAPAPVVVSSKFEDDGVQTKGLKFTLYYEDSNGEGGDDDVAAEETEESGGDEVGAEGCGWEGVLSLRMGEMGWYRYQDLTELKGDVVRLWDGCSRVRERCSSSPASKCCVAW